MTRIPTKLERAQLHALYAPAGKLRDEADKTLGELTEKRLARRDEERKRYMKDKQNDFRR